MEIFGLGYQVVYYAEWPKEAVFLVFDTFKGFEIQ